MKLSLKYRIFDLIDPEHADDPSSRIFNIGMLTLIFLNVLAVILETESSLQLQYFRFFRVFDAFSVAIFTVEYILRIWTCTEDPRFKESIRGRIRFSLQPIMLIDLIAILPFYIQTWSVDLRFIRAVRLLRIFRLLKMGHYSKSLMTLGKVIRSKKEELIVTLFAGIILLIVASSLMYFVEHNVQPENFGSIPDAMWWGAVTLTTVGYGDVYPKTLLGRILGAGIAMLGIGLFALPAGIIASGFAAEIQRNSEETLICPHCGKEIKS